MKTNNRPIYESYSFMDEETCNLLPEKCLDEAIKILDINPNAKENLQADLARVIWAYGGPSPTKLGTAPNELRKHTSNLRKNLYEALNALKKTEYEAAYNAGKSSKESIIANWIRRIGTGPNGLEFSNRSFPAYVEYLAQNVKEIQGEWPCFYHFDQELEQAIEALEKIIPYFEFLEQEMKKKFLPECAVMKGKTQSDMLIWQLCGIYKKYTEKKPTASFAGAYINNPRKVHGGVVPFLKLILPYTCYGHNSESEEALQKKIERMSKDKRFSCWWQDSKK